MSPPRGRPPTRLGLAALVRRGWVVVVVTVLAGVIANAVAHARLTDPTYRSDAILNVPAAYGENGTGGASEATKLAASYAALVPNDRALQRAVASAANVSRTNAADGISASNKKNTSLVEVGFEADSAGAARRGVRALSQALIGPLRKVKVLTPTGLPRTKLRRGHSVSPNIARASLELVQPAGKAKRTDPQPTGGLPIGLLLGFALGVVLMIVWERADRRIDSMDDLRDSADCPASPARGLTDAGASALLTRWHDLAGRRHPRIALHPVTRRASAPTHELAERLRAAVQGAAPPLQRDGNSISPEVSSMSVEVDDTGGGPPADSRRVLTVLTVREGTSAARVEAVVETLRDFGVAAAWAMLMPRRLRGATRTRRPVPLDETPVDGTPTSEWTDPARM